MFRHISKLIAKQLASIFLLSSIIFSMAFLLPSVSGDMPLGNNVSWQSQEETTQNDWHWTNQGWAFGPFPTFSIILANGTKVEDANNYIPLDQLFTVQIDIQKSIFVGNATLGQAGLNWNVDLRSQNGSTTGNANCKMMYVNTIQQQYFNETNTWHIESNINNQTGFDSKGPQGPMPMPQNNGFYQFDSELSRITETELGWRLEITGLFNSTTFKGPYWVNLQISDQYNNFIDSNSQSGQNSLSNNRQVAVGQAGLVYGGLQDYFSFEKLDMQNNPLLSVSKGSEWKMRLNITSAQFTNASIGINLPWDAQEYVNVTGWYQQVITDHGGWVYNQTSETYYWNSTIAITKNQQVFGPHVEQRWIGMPNTNHEITINDVTDPKNNIVATRTINVCDQLFLLYNKATNTFDLKKGYQYSSYDTNLKCQIQYQVLTPIDPSDLASQFYKLSIDDCTYEQTGSNQHVVQFAGYFSNTTDYGQSQYNMQVNVYSATNQIWTNWADTDPSDMQITVDKPVAVSTILDEHGNPTTTQSMFMIGQNKPFIVQSKIYGGTDLHQSLDAVGVSFNSNFGTWTEKENTNSQVEIRLVKNLNSGQITSLSYNRTSVNRYVYGSHLGWAYVNVTDWHTQYNAETGIWDWVESPHLIWNQTKLTDWHWEYYRLNQTENAINPQSPNIWIDTSTCYINEMDPSFLVPSSYAALNSANISLVNGVVTVNLGVTFGATAPQGNYQYNMILQNMTYGQDPSQGWGQHLITEWISEPTYYISGIGSQNLIVSNPAKPLYTVFEGKRYQVNEVPYVTIAGKNHVIKPQVQYDQGQQRDWTQYLISGPYDPSIGRQTQYYQLPNGTNIYVNQAYQTIIRTLQFNTTDAYILVDGSPEQLPSGTIIDTFLNKALPDYSRQHWDQQGNILPYYYEQLNGTKVYLDAPFEENAFVNTTTNHWQRTGTVYTEEVAPLEVTSVGSGVMIGSTIVLLRNPGCWQSLPDNSGYYLVMQNGTRITCKNPWSPNESDRLAVIDGISYTPGWPNQYFIGSTDGLTLLVPNNGQDNDIFVQSYFYTDLGHNDETKYELPYPGAMANQWDLQGIESTGQKIRTMKSVTIENVDYILKQDAPDQPYYIEISGAPNTVAAPTVDSAYFYANIGGQDYWNITQNGWHAKYGNYSEISRQLIAGGSLTTITGFDAGTNTWKNWNRYGYDYENSTMYLMMPNGTRTDVDSTMNAMVWKVQVGNKIYYTTNRNSQSESYTDPSTGQSQIREYFKSLNGDKIYFNFTSPASWQEETHIPIQGNNYTRLIPYTLSGSPAIPNVSYDSATWRFVQTSTASTLQDGTGYYLIASNGSRIDLVLVDTWWAGTTQQRSQLFNGPLSNYYPRFSINIDGQDYFVLDPSQVTDSWNGDWAVSNAIYRYPATISATFGSQSYDIIVITDGHWNQGDQHVTITQLNTINLHGKTYVLEDQSAWKPSFQVTVDSGTIQMQLETMNIYKAHESWGNTFTWKLTDLGVTTTSQINCLIVGTPQYGMWGIKAYKVVESTGAVDLDGDTSTVSDQYFVRKMHDGTESQTQTTQRMMVNTAWNPDSTKIGDDVKLNAWMGQLQVRWTSQWTESYVWYHASDMSSVTNQEMTQIKNTIINTETNQPNPGYWDMAYVVKNQTWEDVLSQAAANHWDWINSNTNEWNWLWFGTDQNYNIDVQSGYGSQSAGVNLKYEFAGLNLLNGTQQTHYFMPKTVGKVNFITPGQAFGNTATSGSMVLPLDSKIDFGVKYDDVNGTLFPYNSQRSMWGWWDSPIFGSDFNSPNFMNKPTNTSIKQMEFMVHFAGTQSQSTSQYNSASMKIDQRIGEWILPADVVDGRTKESNNATIPLVGNEVLQNRSLAINYYVTASTSQGWNVKDDKGTNINNNGVTNSSQFNLASQLSNVNFASVKLGSIYDWGKPTTETDQIRTFNVTSQTTSIQNFQSSYLSGSGKSSTGFDISSSMYFLTQGFPKWDGYSIYNDPEVTTMLSKGTTADPTQPTPPPTQPTTSPTTQPNNGNNNNGNNGGSSNSGSNDGTGSENEDTKPVPSPTQTPQATTTPKPVDITPNPTSSTTEMPTSLILIAACAGIGIAIGSLMLVRTKKNRKKN